MRFHPSHIIIHDARIGTSDLSKQWQRDPNFNYQRLDSRSGELTDDEIDRLRQKPGRVERLMRSAAGILARRREESHGERVELPGAELPGVDFTRRYLEDAIFQGANLQRAVFTGAKLFRANFAEADLREANLAEAVLTGADLRGADLSGANLIGTDFGGADLRGATLTGAYIWGADFHNADVDATDFSGCYAGGALFSHARNLTLEQFRSTIHDETGAYRLSMLPDPPGGKKH